MNTGLLELFLLKGKTKRNSILGMEKGMPTHFPSLRILKGQYNKITSKIEKSSQLSITTSVKNGSIADFKPQRAHLLYHNQETFGKNKML
jgi:hypothetical protein